MNKKSLVIAIYAAFVLVGGIIGYVMAGSPASIIASSVFAAILFGCSYYVSQGNAIAYNITLVVVLFLLGFFGYRFSLGFKIAPGGIMTALSTVVFCYLLFTKEQK